PPLVTRYLIFLLSTLPRPPSSTLFPYTTLFRSQVTPQHIDFMLSKIPRGRFATVEEVAALIAWAASAECSFTTGQVLDISGGRATYWSVKLVPSVHDICLHSVRRLRRRILLRADQVWNGLDCACFLAVRL